VDGAEADPGAVGDVFGGLALGEELEGLLAARDGSSRHGVLLYGKDSKMPQNRWFH
jgi:hypothetical protein